MGSSSGVELDKLLRHRELGVRCSEPQEAGLGEGIGARKETVREERLERVGKRLAEGAE